MNTALTFGYLHEEFLRRCEQADYLGAVERSRPLIREAGVGHMKYMAPMLDRLDHSFSPNCRFDLLYLPHRRCPFVRIRTLQPLEAGETATVDYGRLNNYELLLRYGFTVRDNPHSLFMLPLGYESIMEVFNKNIEWKQQQLLKDGTRLKNYIRIRPDGAIDPSDMRLLRVLCNDEAHPTAESTQQDGLIHELVGRQVGQVRGSLQLEPGRRSSNKHISALEEEEESILNSYLARYG